MEMVMAMLCALTFNMNRGKNASPQSMRDYLFFADPWPDLSRYSEIDRQILQSFGG